MFSSLKISWSSLMVCYGNQGGSDSPKLSAE
jgi:hypothetical protein